LPLEVVGANKLDTFKAELDEWLFKKIGAEKVLAL